MFFLRMPSAAFDSFNFCDDESAIGERNYYATGWIFGDVDPGHRAAPALLKFIGRGILDPKLDIACAKNEKPLLG
jgi:hypothetical protein